ncbi:MAG: arginine--tRNA ligase [Syntrophomonas sp.]|uniref:arginine--tRNA ligase n=1 Tax=Syntrophomonas sp. TaxID=2053627 RepID=UPI0026347CDD|nr:arginine--tRNA ligase [Syntrophomonas sp.]MDD2511117.1 arginine--tRNA ligase [Syntrophomonas sp.]MDD3878375.1 arginine--tRNA ligase [Syntrophomonas sp.]MDD4625526.1 arginine--tRNA ligase [Syntrophomonas sp.]
MNPIQKVLASLHSMVIGALENAKSRGLINFKQIPEFLIEVPREKEHGDFACNVALLMAREARQAPRGIAEVLVELMEKSGHPVEKIEIAGAGFINFFLDRSWLYEIPLTVYNSKDKYGFNEKKAKKVQVEFVSANPTGNLHMGNARGGAIGDTLANILERAGYDVEREFYINDAGNQIKIFTDSMEARYLQLTGHDVQFPENGYAGRDLIDTVRNIIARYGENLYDLPREERRQIIADYALEEKIEYIKKTLASFGISYDLWFSEKSLHENGKIEAVLNDLREKGYIYESEGAWWFKSTAFGDEKDEVVLRANGMPTYFMADIAYHQNKFERGYDWVINVWGADHHGHVARMKGAIEALGYNPARLDILLMQLVRLYRAGNIVRMSKRTGTTVSLDELIEDVGKDAARFFFVMRSPDSHLDFDLELARQKSQENPVYYVQYAHARICSIFRQARAEGITLAGINEIDISCLKEEEELAILRKIADFPEEIAIAARTLAPHRIAHYVLDLAAMFHSFYNHHRVLNDNRALQDARLLLMEITRITIHNALGVLGVTAPEQM